MRIVFYPLINSAIHHRFSRGNVGIVLIPAPLWERVNAQVTLAECRLDKALYAASGNQCLMRRCRVLSGLQIVSDLLPGSHPAIESYEGIAIACFSSSSFSTTPGSASVEVSPRLLVSPAAI